MSKPADRINRRGFLGAVVAAASGAALARSAVRPPSTVPAEMADYVVDDQVRTYSQARRLRITRSGRRVASLIFPTDYPTHFRLKPELHNVCTPRGIPVTGSHEYCFIHHHSIMCGHGKVQVEGSDRPVDFFRLLPFADAGRQDKWHPNEPDHNLFQLGPTGLQEITQARWKAADQVVIQLHVSWRTRRETPPGPDPPENRVSYQ